MHPFQDNSPRDISCRPEEKSDREFLHELYGTTRRDIHDSELTDDQKRNLIHSQFQAQHHHYQTFFPAASYSVICQQDRRIGRIYVSVDDQEIRLIDISLMPDNRGQGTGGHFINQLQQLSAKKSLPLRLRVEPDSPALRLYQRSGFKLVADEEINLHLEWTPPGEEAR